MGPQLVDVAVATRGVGVKVGVGVDVTTTRVPHPGPKVLVTQGVGTIGIKVKLKTLLVLVATPLRAVLVEENPVAVTDTVTVSVSCRWILLTEKFPFASVIAAPPDEPCGPLALTVIDAPAVGSQQI